jgi:hypothetical protein
MIIKLADFVLNQSGNIRSEDLSRLSDDAVQDVAQLYAEQQHISDMLANDLLAATADNICLTNKLSTLTTQLGVMSAAYTAAATAGVVNHIAYHNAATAAPAQLTNCEWSSAFGQVTLARKLTSSINRIPLYLNDDGSQSVASSVTVHVDYTDGGPQTRNYTDRNAGPYLSMLSAPKYCWAETLPVQDYQVTIDVPNIRGASANMLSIIPAPVIGTDFSYLGYLSTAGVYVPITSNAMSGPIRLYFSAQAFSDSIIFTAKSYAAYSGYVIGMYKFGLTQESFQPSGQFIVKLSDYTIHPTAITSFEVDYDLLGIDPTLNPNEYASFQLWAGDPLSGTDPVLIRALDVPLGLTKDMPPSVVSTGGDVISDLYLVGTFKAFAGVTPVYRGAKITYLA